MAVADYPLDLVENKKVWIAADYFVGVAAWDLGWLGIGLFGQLPPGLDRYIYIIYIHVYI
jgi:hypothetical protein